MDARFGDAAGESRLADLRGRPVVVVFFATWCMPCLAMIPALVQLHERHPEIHILAVGMDLEGRTVLEPFRRHYGLRFPVVPAGREVASGRSGFGQVTELPATALLDSAGRPVAGWGGPVSLEAFEEALRAVDR